MAEYRGIEYLRRKLNQKRIRVMKRYRFYEMKYQVRDFEISSPESMRWLSPVLGWCGKAADSIADRLVFREFEDDNFDLNEIFKMNNPDLLFDSAVLSACIASCAFIYVSPDETGFPRLQVIDGGNATGIIDETTGLLKEGYAVLERDDYQNPTLEAWFTPGRTDYQYADGSVRSYPNSAPYPLLVPIILRPDAMRPFGHSRISRACMNIVSSAVRTVKRSEVTAEFYSFPQKWVVGTSPDAEEMKVPNPETQKMEKWKQTISMLLEFSKDEDGEHPQVGQFQQQSMAPHTEQLRTFAALFSGETGLTLDDLGFVSENPASVEAIRAAHENLRLTARKAQRSFGSGFLNAGYLAACVRDDYPYQRRQLYLTKPAWEPIFEPDASMLNLMGDGIIKINQAVPGYFNLDNMRSITGIPASSLPAPTGENIGGTE